MGGKETASMWTICEGVEKDLAQIADLEEEIFTDPWSLQGLKESMEQSQTFFIVAKKQGVVLGYAVVYYVLDECEIARIAVSGSVRREGAGTLILQKVSEKCGTLGVQRILLDVRKSNAAAVSFYRARGFAEDGVRKAFYTNPSDDAVLMSRGIFETRTGRTGNTSH